jgi:dihydrofolate reductase
MGASYWFIRKNNGGITMRKLILFNMITLDGFFEGPGHDISWHNVDDEFNEMSVKQINSVDAILFGRVTYEMMASYWPAPEAIETDPIIANLMNSWPKIVFSRTLKNAAWNNTRLVYGEAVDEIKKLKKLPGKDLIIFGSANLASSLTRAGLIDEYRIIINPLILGSGVPNFQNVAHPIPLKLSHSRVFANGNIWLSYQLEGTS